MRHSRIVQLLVLAAAGAAAPPPPPTLPVPKALREVRPRTVPSHKRFPHYFKHPKRGR